MASGIYSITNLLSGKVYVGSSSKVSERWTEHKRQLNKGIHHSSHLQHAWTLYGEESFLWEILEETSNLRLIEREQHWIDAFDSANRRYGYNACPAAGSTRGLTQNLSSEARQRLRDNFIGANNPNRRNPKIGDKHPRFGYRKPVCKNGHPRIPSNINTIGCCRTCANDYSKRWQYAKRHNIALS